MLDTLVGLRVWWPERRAAVKHVSRQVLELMCGKREVRTGSPRPRGASPASHTANTSELRYPEIRRTRYVQRPSLDYRETFPTELARAIAPLELGRSIRAISTGCLQCLLLPGVRAAVAGERQCAFTYRCAS